MIKEDVEKAHLGEQTQRRPSVGLLQGKSVRVHAWIYCSMERRPKPCTSCPCQTLLPRLHQPASQPPLVPMHSPPRPPPVEYSIYSRLGETEGHASLLSKVKQLEKSCRMWSTSEVAGLTAGERAQLTGYTALNSSRVLTSGSPYYRVLRYI